MRGFKATGWWTEEKGLQNDLVTFLFFPFLYFFSSLDLNFITVLHFLVEKGKLPLSKMLQSGGASSRTVLKKGYLQKQGGRLFSRWQERYFVLDRDQLHWFKGAECDEELGCVEIVDAKVVKEVRASGDHTFLLSITSTRGGSKQGKTYTLSCSSEVDLNSWFRVLQSASNPRMANPSTYLVAGEQGVCTLSYTF